MIGPVWPVGAGCYYSKAALPMPLSKLLYITSYKIHAFLTRMVKPNILVHVSSHFLHRQTFILGGPAAYGEIFFGKIFQD